ncbi:hypothetical protein [Brevundimonas diminuta]|jgi:hypothetical protein|uniref:hypothetical protein n=1 Tax=Brevundimonas diminuta TaxID=293 RepID=UPI0030FC45C3
MTPDQLNDALDAMTAAAGDNIDLLPGLIEVNSEEWCETLYAIEKTTRSLDEGIRHREIKVVISSAYETRVLTRAELANAAHRIGI